MRYRLRTLMILLAVLPPLLALGWAVFAKHLKRASRPEVVIWSSAPREIMKYQIICDFDD